MLNKRVHFDNSYKYNPRYFDGIILYQIGDLICEPAFCIHEHEQICYEISFVVSGKGKFYTNGYAYDVNKNDIHICKPNDIHDGIADEANPYRFFYLGFSFSDELIRKDRQIRKIKTDFDTMKHHISCDLYKIYQPFIEIFNEIINNKELLDLIIRSNLYRIIILAHRCFFGGDRIEYNSMQNGDASKIIMYNVINYIDSNIGSISELKEIAAVLGYSYSHIAKVFSNEMGISIQEYYERKRFDYATELLKDPNINITKISDILGYQSIHSFSKAFKNRFDCSPHNYRMLICNK